MGAPRLSETTIHLIDYLLQRGWKQHRIAAAVGSTQGTVSEIKRRVKRYENYTGYEAPTPAHRMIHEAHMQALVRQIEGKSRSKAA